MIQNLIQTKYDLEVIGLIQLSPKVYKVKTKQGFYCVKIIQEKMEVERIKQLESEMAQTYDPRQQAKILQEIINSKEKE